MRRSGAMARLRAIGRLSGFGATLFAFTELSAVCVSPSFVWAQERVSPADVIASVRRVISDQIAAFKANNGERALSFAAPSIRTAFPTADVFMAMVRGGYAPVYRPSQVTFGFLKS